MLGTVKWLFGFNPKCKDDNVIRSFRVKPTHPRVIAQSELNRIAWIAKQMQYERDLRKTKISVNVFERKNHESN